MGEQFELIGKNRRTIKKNPGTRITKTDFKLNSTFLSPELKIKKKIHKDYNS